MSTDKELFGLDVRKLFRVGGSLAFTIPKSYAEAHGLREGGSVKVFYNDIIHAEPLTQEEIRGKVERRG